MRKDFSEKEEQFHKLTIEEAYKIARTSDKGLSSQQAEQRLQRYGLNELKAEEGIHPFRIFLEQFSSPLVWILLLFINRREPCGPAKIH